MTLLHYDLDLPSRTFCEKLLEETGVLLVPGSVFGVEGCVRIGFGNGTETLKAALPLVSDFLRRHGR